MFRKVLGKLESFSVKDAAKKGKLRCPECGESAQFQPAHAHELLKCPACGAEAPAGDWADVKRGWADRPPAGTKVIRTEENGVVTWRIPASGKSQIFGFGVIWTMFTGGICGFLAFVLVASLFSGKSDAPWYVTVGILPLLLIMPGIGCVLVYFGAMEKWAQLTLRVSPDSVEIRRALLGRERETRLPRAEVTKVDVEEFYRSNEKPVYGVRISGKGKEKIKFGSGLPDEDKFWLAADLKRSIFGEASGKERVSGTHGIRSQVPVFSIPIPDARKHVMTLSVVLMITGIVMITICGFVFHQADGFRQVAEDGKAPVLIRGIGIVAHTGASMLEIVAYVVSSLMTLVGLFWFRHNWSKRHDLRTLDGDSHQIRLRVTRHGRVISEKSFPRAEVRFIRAKSSGQSNGREMKRIDLWVNGNEERLAYWVPAEQADQFVAEVKNVLW